MRTSKLRLVIAVTGTLFGAELAAACGGADAPQPSPQPGSTSGSTASGSQLSFGPAVDAGDIDASEFSNDSGTGSHFW